MDGSDSKGSEAGESFPRSVRITASDEIRRLLRRGKRGKTRYLDVFFSASPVSRPRLALVVPKPRMKTSVDGLRVRGAGVQRNRMKRRLRELGRRRLLPGLAEAGCNMDVLIRVRPEGYGAAFQELGDDVARIQELICSEL